MRDPVPPKTRGLCPACKRDYQVRDDGRLPWHGPRGKQRCTSSRQWPTAYRAPGGKWKAREA